MSNRGPGTNTGVPEGVHCSILICKGFFKHFLLYNNYAKICDMTSQSSLDIIDYKLFKP